MKHLKLFVALFAMLALGVGNAWAESETVTFTNKDWAPWTNITSGSQFESSGSARGVANNGVNGSCSSTKEYSNVTKISYVASSNTTGGKVTIKVGDTTVGESSIPKENNKTFEYDVDNLSGTITVSVTKPSSKTVWVKSVTIETISTGGEDPEPTPEKTATSLVWSTAEYTATIGADNTYPTLTTEPADLAGVTYASSNTAAATIAADGTITLVAAGTTTITASYAGNETYAAATDATYTLTVKAATSDPEEPENPEQPEVITCAQAVEICETTGETSTTETYTIHGYVTSIKTAYSSTHGNISFWMADTKDGGEVLQCYRVVPVKDGEENVKVGDKVEVIGTLVNYKGNTPEVNAGGTYTILEVAAGGETPDPEEPENPGEGGDNVTYVFAEDANNPGNATDWFTGTIDSYTTWTATKGDSNNPKYYDKGTGLRVYNGGTFSITSTKLIETVTLTFDGTSYTFSTDNTENPQTVTVNANSYEWSVGRTCRLQKIEIVYGSSDVVIVKTLQSIALSGMTTTYETGDVFNFNGTCTATYAVTKDDVAQEDEQKVVTPTSVSEPDMSTTGEKEVTVTYTEEDVTVIATYTITVNLAEGDKLVLEATGVEGTSYVDWSNVQGASGAVYAGNSAGGNNSIQLRKSAEDKPAAGIITTTSGGLIRKVKVGWNINTADGRTLNVYGKNSAYTAVSELYDNATAGELLGTIVEGTSTELVINGDFEYVGLVSASGALYLDKVVFVWEENEDPDGPTTALDNVAVEGKAVKAIINGQLIIIKNGVQYNAQGQVIK